MGSRNHAARLVKVSKAYGPTRALDDLDLTLDRGEILALLGPNGAGKTTAVSVLTGSRRVDSGSVELLGGSPRNLAIRRRIGLTPQESGFPNALRVGEILRLVRAHYPAPLADPVLFDRFPLQPLLRRQAGGLSGGQKRMLAVALAFVAAAEAAAVTPVAAATEAAGTTAPVEAFLLGRAFLHRRSDADTN